MTTIEHANKLINDFKGNKQEAYLFAVSHSVVREDDALFEMFGENMEEKRNEYKAVAEYIKNNF